MDGSLADWLGRYDAESTEGAFRARGLNSPAEICGARLTPDDLIALGVEPLWRRSALLSGILEANRDTKALADDGWADFGDEAGGTGDLLGLASAAGTAAPAPAVGLMDLLGGDSFTAAEPSRAKAEYALETTRVVEWPDTHKGQLGFQLEQVSSQRAGGLGATVTRVSGGSHAFDSGVQVGWLVEKVNEASVAGLTREQVMGRMREVGLPLQVHFAREVIVQVHKLGFDVVETSPEKPARGGSLSPQGQKGGGAMADLFMDDGGPSTSAELPHYRVVCKAMVRSGFASESADVGGLEVGDCFKPVEERLSGQGIARVRFGGGWISKVAGDGTILVTPTTEPVTTTVATTMALSPQPRGLSLQPTNFGEGSPSGSLMPADRHADALLAGIDDLLGELDDEEESPTDYSFRGQTGYNSPPSIGGGGGGGGSPGYANGSPGSGLGSPPGFGSPGSGLGSPPGVDLPGGEIRDALGRLVSDTATLTVGMVKGSMQVTKAIDGKLGGHGMHAAQVMDERLAVSQTLDLVGASAAEKAAKLKEFDESHHISSSVAGVGMQVGRKGLTLSKAGVDRAAPVAGKVGGLTMDGIDLTREQLKALRDKILALRNGGEGEDDEKASRLEALESMFRTSPRSAAAALADGVDEWMTVGKEVISSHSPSGGGGSPGLGEMPRSDPPRPAHKARGDQEYDYGSYGGVSLEDAAAGLEVRFPYCFLLFSTVFPTVFYCFLLFSTVFYCFLMFSC